jgi:L-rhamnose mutarotase
MHMPCRTLLGQAPLYSFEKVAGEGGSQGLAGNPIVRKWWDHMSDLMEVHSDNSPVSMPMEEMFYLE